MQVATFITLRTHNSLVSELNWRETHSELYSIVLVCMQIYTTYVSVLS